MSRPRPVRTRTVLVVGTAALAVVTATASVSAHEGGAAEGTVHACATAATGALRVLADASQQCRPNETQLHWTVGDGSSADLEAFREQLAAGDGAGDLVHWSNLAGLPSWLADGEVGYDELAGAIALAAGSVDGATVADGSLTGADLADDSIWSADILNGTVQTEDLSNGAVTGGKISDGTVTAGDLAGSYGNPFVPGAVTGEKIADGAVEPRDLRPEAASSSTGSGSIPLSSAATSVGSAPVTAQGGSLVTVSGQVQLSWPGACSGCTEVVAYQLVRDGQPVGPLYQVQLSPDHAQDVAAVSFLDSFPADGTHAYGLRLSTSGSAAGISASGLVLTAQVLGPG